MEIDATEFFNLQLLSVWNNGAYRDEMQDSHIYDFGNGLRVLVVKNNETFFKVAGRSSASRLDRERRKRSGHRD